MAHDLIPLLNNNSTSTLQARIRRILETTATLYGLAPIQMVANPIEGDTP
jgi:hypothetical protein